MVHIKSIQIQGFKSYKNQTFGDEKGNAQEFSPQVNSIAIQFVLSEKYSKLKSEERQALLHIDKKEVAIRRTIGLKKDEFRIDNKAVTQKEVTSLLESAGFSSSNPYYIVEQGKVSLLTTMKDVERLNLLKEVAGTRVYDERRKESLKIVQETDSKLEQIKEVIDTIEEKLEDLEKEKKEYKMFLSLDKEKKSIEYTLYDKELSEAVQNLEQIEKARHESHNSANQLHSNTISHHERIKEVERKIKDLTHDSNQLKKQRDTLAEERQEMIRNRTKFDLELKDEESLHKSEKTTKTNLKKNIADLNKKIKEVQNTMDEITPKLDKVLKNEESIDKSLASRDRRQKELYSKAGRQLKFKTTKERDVWIKNEVKERESNIANDQKQAKALELDISKLETEKTSLKEKITSKTKSLEEKKKVFAQENQKLLVKKQERDDLANEKKTLWKSENEVSKKLAKLEEELDRNKKKLDSTSSSVVNKGIQEMWKIVREHALNVPKVTVYGTVIELFDVDDLYAQAVEVVAGNALFNVVVENSETASKIINIMNQQKSPGRITFMPLNRLNTSMRNYPNSDVYLPLISKIKFENKFKGVFVQIFGKTVISNQLDSSASTFSRTNGLNCVTLDGDQINSKGALSGGFSDFRTSRLETFKTISKLNDSLENESDVAKKLKINLNELESKSNMTMSEVVKIEEEINKLQNTITLESSELRQMVTREKTFSELVSQQVKSLSTLEISIKNNQETIASLAKELETELNEQLTSNERKEMDTLSEEISKLKNDQMNVSREHSDLETKRNELLNSLNTNLLPRVEELKEQLDIIELQNVNSSVDYKQKEFERIQLELENVTNTLKSTDDELEKTLALIRTESDELEKIKSEESKQEKKLAEKANQLEKLLNKRNIWIKKKEDCIRQIRELGSLPQDHTKYAQFSSKDLMIKLQAANEELKKYSHVNKKALDQYDQFSEQRDDFVNKKQDLDNSKEAIHKLIEVLDKRKDEAIIRTFKQVTKNFTEIFAELVPGGKASLVMNSSGDEETDNVSKCSGISITVLFHGEGEPQIMQQLSGGQKSLVALTLIFAIQRCDPAPFYLFDEIDAALDSAHRLAVAKMIQKQSENIQFVIASFKKEMLDVANQYYGIYFKNKVSQIKSTTKQESIKILEDEERAVQSGKEVQEEEIEEEEEEEEENE